MKIMKNNWNKILQKIAKMKSKILIIIIKLNSVLFLNNKYKNRNNNKNNFMMNNLIQSFRQVIIL